MSAADILAERKRAMLARCPAAVLVETVEILGDPPFGSAARWTLTWACDELERRYPTIGDPLDAWCDSGEGGPSYGAVLLEALAGLAEAAP